MTTVPTWLAVAAILASPVSAAVTALIIFSFTGKRENLKWLREERLRAYLELLTKTNGEYVERLESEKARVADGQPARDAVGPAVLPHGVAEAADAVELLGPPNVANLLLEFLNDSVWAPFETVSDMDAIGRLDLARDEAQKRLVRAMNAALNG